MSGPVHPESQHWMGFSESIQSCHFIKNMYGKSWKIRFYNTQDSGGQVAECAEDGPSIYEFFKFREFWLSVIVFYEGQDFQGKSYDCKGDSADLYNYIRRCNSVKVQAGWWALYERNNFSGYQYIIGPGEYTGYGQWMGFNDCVRSCKIIKNCKGPLKLKLYGRPNFNGPTLEVTDNLNSLREKWPYQVMSCKVLQGSWVFYEHPNFSGRQYLLEKGEYGSPAEWGALTATIGSVRGVMELPKSDS